MPDYDMSQISDKLLRETARAAGGGAVQTGDTGA